MEKIPEELSPNGSKTWTSPEEDAAFNLVGLQEHPLLRITSRRANDQQ